jgi:hypothetical protein
MHRSPHHHATSSVKAVAHAATWPWPARSPRPEQTRQVAIKYRPGLVVIDNRPAAAPPTGGRA